jgi:hypothetical protein
MNSRTDFTIQKTYGALRWMVISGTATFFLTGLLEVVKEFKMPSWAVLLTYLVINTAIFAIAKYKEGGDNQ